MAYSMTKCCFLADLEFESFAWQLLRNGTLTVIWSLCLMELAFCSLDGPKVHNLAEL